MVFLTRFDGRQVLLMHRRPDYGGFWHAVSGTIELGETPEGAAAREVFEETGLDATALIPFAARTSYAYALPLRRTNPRKSEKIQVHCFCVRGPINFTPTLNEEHDSFEWCAPAEAYERLHWRNAADALRELLGPSGL